MSDTRERLSSMPAPVDVSSWTARTRVAVIMQRRTIESRWQCELWAPLGILPDYPAEDARVLLDAPALTQILYPGFEIVLQRAEAQGYFHNVSSAAPSAFVLWRMEDARAVPHYVTVSYDEASRWMDGGAQVDSVVMPNAIREWLVQFVERHYRPQPKKRIRPQSFLAPSERGPL